MSTMKTSHEDETNTTDATRGEPLATRALERKAELEQVLASTPKLELRARADIERALGAIGELLTGDLEHLPHVVGSEINTWLENTKHLAELAQKPPATTN